MGREDHSSGTVRQARGNPDARRPAYVPVADHFAVHDRSPGTPAPGAALLLEDGAVAVFRGAPDDDTRRTARIGPVYRSEKGRLAVPTGRILVRFREGVRADTRRREIEAAGYDIEEVLPYAAQAAWVRRTGGDIAGSLSQVDELRKLSDVENVEPQMLTQRAPRDRA
jgi:hypothetical protein